MRPPAALLPRAGRNLGPPPHALQLPELAPVYVRPAGGGECAVHRPRLEIRACHGGWTRHGRSSTTQKISPYRVFYGKHNPAMNGLILTSVGVVPNFSWTPRLAVEPSALQSLLQCPLPTDVLILPAPGLSQAMDPGGRVPRSQGKWFVYSGTRITGTSPTAISSSRWRSRATHWVRWPGVRSAGSPVTVSATATLLGAVLQTAGVEISV